MSMQPPNLKVCVCETHVSPQFSHKLTLFSSRPEKTNTPLPISKQRGNQIDAELSQISLMFEDTKHHLGIDTKAKGGESFVFQVIVKEGVFPLLHNLGV